MSNLDILTFASVALLLVISPGPNGILIAKTVPTSGRGAGFANVAGFVFAFYLHGALSILGLSAILLSSSKAFLVLKLLGAVYLCWLGYKALRASFSDAQTVKNIAPKKQVQPLLAAFFEGLLTNALNPKVSMFYLAAFPQFMSTQEGAVAPGFALVSIHASINALWFGMMVLLFAQFAHLTRGGLFRRWMHRLTGMVLIGFGIKLATFHR